MGYINLPVIDEDKAKCIYGRCLLKPKFACDDYLNSVRDGFVDDAIHALAASGAQSFGDCMAALNQLRSGTHDTADKAG